MTARALAEELEVSRRTILRDINALSFSGVPVYSEGGHGGGIALAEEYRTTLTGLNTLEVQSLFVANNNEALRDVGLGDAGERLLLKFWRRCLTRIIHRRYIARSDIDRLGGGTRRPFRLFGKRFSGPCMKTE